MFVLIKKLMALILAASAIFVPASAAVAEEQCVEVLLWRDCI